MKYINSEFMEQKVLELLKEDDGLSDSEISEKLNFLGFTFQQVSLVCRQLAYKDFIRRKKKKGGAMRNYYNMSAEGLPIKIDEGKEVENEVLRVLSKEVGLTDEQVKDKVNRQGFGITYAGMICRQLASKGIIVRIREDGEPVKNLLA